MSQLSAADASQVSELVAGRFQLTHRLARGGAGEVFAALDRSTGAPIALKRLLPDIVELPGSEPSQRYNVFALHAKTARVALAVLRDTEGALPQVPSSLLAEIGRALREA